VYTSGGDVIEAISVPVFADIASGLGVDTYDSIYFSGRRYDNDKLTAFVFKYGAKAILPVPQPAGDITEPMVFCPPDATLLVKTSPIGGASSYEWEITFNNTIITLVSDNPEIEIVTEDLGITGDFSVRVRGLNETGYGPYSPIHVLKAETILPAPYLFASCNTVFTNEDNQSVQWYLNNQVLSGVENTTSIQPTGNGNYHITISNTCGVVKSNEIDFQTLMPESIFMPNIITPNDDDINEYLILDEKLESPRLKVFNRWGKIIYSAEEYTNQWNGADVPSGVYFYLVYSTCLSKPIQGTLTIVR